MSTTSFDFEEGDADTSNSSTVRDGSICVDNEMETSDDENDDQLLRGIADDMIGRKCHSSRRSASRRSATRTTRPVASHWRASSSSCETRSCPRTAIHTPRRPSRVADDGISRRSPPNYCKAVNARESKDVVLFAGQGCTSAIQKLISALGINTSKRLRLSSKRPVVFTGPFAHHSNLLPWRESLAADIVEIPEEWRRSQRMRMDVDKISRLLHRHGALACWDYATCAPYVEIDMNPSDPLQVEYILDAMNFVADHGWKFLPQYEFDIHSAAWRHSSRSKDNLRRRAAYPNCSSSATAQAVRQHLTNPFAASQPTARKPRAGRTSGGCCMKEAALLDSFPEGQKVLKATSGCVGSSIHAPDGGARPPKRTRCLLAVVPPTKEGNEDTDLLSPSSINPLAQTDTSSIDLEAERIDQQKKKTDDDDDDKHDTESETSSSSNSITDVLTTPATDMEIALGADDIQVEEEHEELDLQLLHDIAENMIGRNVPFETPFGTKAQCYADYTASGKAIESIETFIRNEVMPPTRQLRSYQSRDLKIGTFAAASNLTGVLADVDKVSKLLHKYGALSCWDYATCAPYVDLDMNPKDPAAYKDAVFFSGHKFVGGPGSPGVLVVKKKLMSNEVPTMPGGGTVLFVTEKAHSYLANKVEREEGGTPDILGSIRLGLAFELKQRVGPKHIMDLERQHVRHVRSVLAKNENIILLGHRMRTSCRREHITALGYAVVAKDEVLKPGVARMSFPYFADEDEVEYILDSVNFVADHGWKFLPKYEYDPHNGAWRHVSRATAPFPAKKFLASMQLDDVDTVRQSVCVAPIRSIAAHRRENLEQAAVLADACIKEAVSAEEFLEGQKLVPAHEWLRWFVYPHEAVAAYKETGEKMALTEKIEGPCQPQRYLDGSVHKIWEGVPSLGTMKRSLLGRFVLKVFMQAELEAMKDKRTDVEKSVLNDEEAMCAVFGGSQKCHAYGSTCGLCGLGGNIVADCGELVQAATILCIVIVSIFSALPLHHSSITMALPDEGASTRFFCEELEEDLTSQIQEQSPLESAPDQPLSAATQQAVDLIARNVVGRQTLFESPFGSRALCYADFTASSKPLQCVEDYLNREVMPLYGNTHTTTSITGLQTTCFRHEARQIVAQAVNAKITGRGAEDCVLFTGQGSTSAINKLVEALGLQQFSANAASNQRPVVFVGPFEHHSNLLPWRETAAEIVMIRENEHGQMDLEALEMQLQTYAARPLKIGAFSAASNLTGVLTDVDAVSALLHQHGALACWDYATCAPYVNIDMNPVVTDETRRPFVYKDAVFISGHKFIGGPGSPGVLIVKKRLLTNAVPTVPGGGTVFFVTENDHRYLSNRAEREEGGTPDILGSIRLGLAFELKQRVGTSNIMTLERRNVQRVRESLQQNENIVLLGRQDGAVEQIPSSRSSCASATASCTTTFVCALLNDLFGVQTRGGCQCAGPYATRLLGLARRDVLALESALIEKKEMLRPGFTRMSFPYFMSPAELEYVLAAVNFVASDGWKFLPQYKFNHKSGVWKHWTRFTKFPDRKWISHFATALEDKTRSKTVPSQVVAASAAQMLEQADDEALRWFVYPSEAVEALKKGEKPAITEVIRGPYQPARYLTGELKDQWKDVTTSMAVSAPVCGLTPCCPVPSAPVSSNSGSSRETGGKYPLRSTNGPDAVEAPATTQTNVNCSSGNCNPGLCGVPTAPTCSTAATVQETTTAITEKTTKTKLFPTPPKKLLRWVGQALMQWEMIQEGDRLLLGVSGGKDSLSLLHVLLRFQKRAPVRFELACATVDPQTPSFDPSPLKEYMQAWAWTIVRSFFMSAMHNGQLRTMKAKYWNDQRDVEVLRPLAYVREIELKKFAYDSRLPVINENCPACFEEPKERHRVKKMLAQEESLYPDMYNSLRRALLPLMDDASYAPLEAVRARVEQAKQERKRAPSSKSRGQNNVVKVQGNGSRRRLRAARQKKRRARVSQVALKLPQRLRFRCNEHCTDKQVAA
ncbi:Pyridoxal phosphate-dependent transferase [Phytophthora cactorum]|nr:Pyridoxal phosphate-dependent transferase [Phytophthora cactorum]